MAEDSKPEQRIEAFAGWEAYNRLIKRLQQGVVDGWYIASMDVRTNANDGEPEGTAQFVKAAEAPSHRD